MLGLSSGCLQQHTLAFYILFLLLFFAYARPSVRLCSASSQVRALWLGGPRPRTSQRAPPSRPPRGSRNSLGNRFTSSAHRPLRPSQPPVPSCSAYFLLLPLGMWRLCSYYVHVTRGPRSASAHHTRPLRASAPAPHSTQPVSANLPIAHDSVTFWSLLPIASSAIQFKLHSFFSPFSIL